MGSGGEPSRAPNQEVKNGYSMLGTLIGEFFGWLLARSYQKAVEREDEKIRQAKQAKAAERTKAHDSPNPNLPK